MNLRLFFFLLLSITPLAKASAADSNSKAAASIVVKLFELNPFHPGWQFKATVSGNDEGVGRSISIKRTYKADNLGGQQTTTEYDAGASEAMKSANERVAYRDLNENMDLAFKIATEQMGKKGNNMQLTFAKGSKNFAFASMQALSQAEQFINKVD